MNKIKKDDQVIVITGKNKGQKAKVLRVLPNGKALVEGVNKVKKHTKPNPNKGIKGGIIEKEMPIQLSNVLYYDSVSDKGSRIGFKILEDGRKVRFLKTTKEVIDT